MDSNRDEMEETVYYVLETNFKDALSLLRPLIDHQNETQRVDAAESAYRVIAVRICKQITSEITMNVNPLLGLLNQEPGNYSQK